MSSTESATAHSAGSFLHCFTAETAATPREPGSVCIPLPGPSNTPAEAWSLGPAPRHSQTIDGLHLSVGADFSFCRVEFVDPPDGQLQDAFDSAYDRILRWLPEAEHRHLWRTWNFLPRINAGSGDDERYRRFVAGRHQAFTRHAVDAARYPAATAIGSPAGNCVVLCLSGKSAATFVENPRQVSAYQYPREYGPHSPAFARAARVQWGNTDRLLVSGTASVVGHATRHPHDWAAQIDEIAANLDSLLKATPGSAHAEAARLYLRAGVPATAASDRLRQHLGADLPLIVLYGDICRDDLLVEVEGVWQMLPSETVPELL